MDRPRPVVGPHPSPQRFLLVDDDPSWQELIALCLAHRFPACHVERVANGLSALAAARADPPSLAVVDFDLPGLNGLELTAALRGLPDGWRFPILIVSATVTDSDWRLLRLHGADGFIPKRRVADQLGDRVEALFSEGTPLAP